MATLLVILSESISEILDKGEYSPRYYNPGNLFSDVIFLLTNADAPDPARLQPTVGDARLQVYNLPSAGQFLKTAGWQPPLLADWAQPAVELARGIGPDLVRCYGSGLNSYLASRIKQELGIPYLVSLHTNPDASLDVLGRQMGFKERLYHLMHRRLARYGLGHADLVLPVYEPIIPYLQQLGIKHYEVAYNAINSHVQQKDHYELHEPIRIVSTGRQIIGKHPEHILRAVKNLPNVHLTLFGAGPGQPVLQKLAASLELNERVTFVPRIDNAELCRRLPEFDLFVAHSEYWEISKSVLEPLLTGLPVILNRRQGEPVPELRGDFLLLVDNTTEGYQQAMGRLIVDDVFRTALGRKAYAHAQGLWAPQNTEAKYVEIYRRYLPPNAEGPPCDLPMV